MAVTVEAQYVDGVLKPLTRLDLPQPSVVRLTVEVTATEVEKRETVLALARRSYEGLSEDALRVIEGSRLRPDELHFLTETAPRAHACCLTQTPSPCCNGEIPWSRKGRRRTSRSMANSRSVS